MEKWKLGVIAALLLGLIGYGYIASKPPIITPPPPPKPAPSKYMGKVLGSEALPEWNNITTWTNTPKSIPLSSLKGKATLVEVFRTECPHCQQAAKPMEQLYARYAPRGLKMVAIESPADRAKNSTSPEADWIKIQAWIKERGLKYPVGFDAQSNWFQGKVKGDFYPTILVFDSSGTVVYEATGHDNTKFMTLTGMLERLLSGTDDLPKRSQEVAKWLSGVLELGNGSTGPTPEMMQELAKDIEPIIGGKPQANSDSETATQGTPSPGAAPLPG